MIESLNALTSLLDANRKCDGPLLDRGRATVTGTIWSLHRVIADPSSSVGDVRTAKRLLLRLLEKTKAFPPCELLEAEMRDVEVPFSCSAAFSHAAPQRSLESNRSRVSAPPCSSRS